MVKFNLLQYIFTFVHNLKREYILQENVKTAIIAF